ncbi:S8 family peptidase [Proteinivorax hydrogeniformans]|uniref:S8 family peptidase n=1 Tax=Proteinivorax hydrogeniformans TaxID=1826727 RepID=A0AAU8HVG2_9FIRM
MRKRLSVMLILILTLTTFAGAALANEDDNSYVNNEKIEIIEGEMIVTISKNTGLRAQKAQEELSKHVKAIEKSGFKVKGSILGEQGESGITIRNFDDNKLERLTQSMGFVYLVDYSERYDSMSKASKALEKQLAKQGVDVEYIEPNYKLYALGTPHDDMHPNQQWHYEMINAPQTWSEFTVGSQDVTVAILDTGIDYNHESLRNLVDTNLGKNYTTSNQSDFMDRQGHGTHVAGTVASYNKVTGVAYNVTLIPVKVLGDDGSGSLFNIINGITYATDIGADIINMSLGGGGFSQSMNNACEAAAEAGTIPIAASGNNGRSSISYPANYDSVMAVGSVDSNGNRSSFSNYGDGLDLVAPGRNIYSTTPNNRYNTFSGTSMAAPHVAGVASLVRSVDSSLSTNEVINILNNTAQQAGSFYQYGHGIVDAYAAVAQAYGDTTPDPDPEVEVIGHEIRDIQTWTETRGWWWWTITEYHISADVYIILCDGTEHYHGQVSEYSSQGYPTIEKTVNGEAIAQSTNEKIPYSKDVVVEP